MSDDKCPCEKCIIRAKCQSGSMSGSMSRLNGCEILYDYLCSDDMSKGGPFKGARMPREDFLKRSMVLYKILKNERFKVDNEATESHNYNIHEARRGQTTKVTKCPCKKCITYAICRVRVREMVNPNVSQLSHISDCQLLKRYLKIHKQGVRSRNEKFIDAARKAFGLSELWWPRE